MTTPSVFVSYSHDSQAHKKWVLDFATRLCKVGIDASLDQWALGPGDDIPLFMERSLGAADRVIMVCTENYVRKANAGTGGVGYEKMIITSDLMKTIDSNNVIPVIRQSGIPELPTFLKTKLYINFSREDQFEESFDDLARSIHNAPLFQKPEISISPFEPIASAVKRTGDPQLELMKHLMSAFEQQRNGGNIFYRNALDRWPGSRAMFDILLEGAKADGLIKINNASYIEVTIKGKMYAVERKIVE